jgi:HK97 family phage major capsid protein
VAITIGERSYHTEQEARARIEELDREHAGQRFPDDAKDEWNRLNEFVEELTVRQNRLIELAQRPGSREAGATFGRDGTAPPPVNGEVRRQALLANERAVFLPERAREHMEKMLREDDDPQDRLAQVTVALSDRAYLRAFAAWFNDPVSGGHLWTDKEREAVQRVRHLERSMTLGTGSAGGFLVPYELDPNIIITASYADPMRAISRVATTAVNEKRFVTSAGATSSWDPEETEVSDDSPTLAQPTITAKKAMTFVPVSFELFEDSDIAQQIGKVFAESKAAHESLSFTLSQTNGPVGLISALVAAGGSTVIATGTNVLAAVDIYNAAGQLPARWRANANWMTHAITLNGYRQIPKATNINESIVDDATTPPNMVGRSVYENSNMDSALTGAAADYLTVIGDFQQYAIVDRIGTVLELVPHLFGTNRRPTGQRGFLQHWRTGADVLVADAFRLLNYST